VATLAHLRIAYIKFYPNTSMVLFKLALLHAGPFKIFVDYKQDSYTVNLESKTYNILFVYLFIYLLMILLQVQYIHDNTTQQLSIHNEGVDLTKGELWCTLPRVFVHRSY